jgi:hypothetical protein
LARRQLGQIGYQDFGMLGAHVAPLFAQHHSSTVSEQSFLYIQWCQ